MLELFREFAEKYKLSFGYGYKDQLNVNVERIRGWPMIYVEGYGEGKKTFDKNGKLNTTYSISLWVFQAKAYTVAPEIHSSELLMLENWGDSLLKYLTEYGSVSECNFAKIVNVKITDKPLDGIRYQFQASPTLQRKVCL